VSKKIIIIAGPNGVGIRRRFAAGLRNLERVYKQAVDTWAVYDNAGVAATLLEWSEQP